MIKTQALKIKEMKRSSISLRGGEQWEKIYGFSRAKVIEDPNSETKQPGHIQNGPILTIL